MSEFRSLKNGAGNVNNTLKHIAAQQFAKQ